MKNTDFKIVGVTDDVPPYQIKEYWISVRSYFLWAFPSERLNIRTNDFGDAPLSFTSAERALSFINAYYELNLTIDDVEYEEI